VNLARLIQNSPANGGFTSPPIAGNGIWSIQNALVLSAPPNLPNIQGNKQSEALRNFLSIYALTQKDGTNRNGTWAGLTDSIKNGDAVRTSLFGSGIQNNQQLIQNVWIGSNDANPYLGINAVLSKLGFVRANGLHHGQQPTHQSHFHIDLRAPVRVGLPEKLLADNATLEQTTPVASDALIAYAQSRLDEVKTDMNLSQGEVTMFILDMPNVPPQDAPVMIAQVNQAQSSAVRASRTVGICQIIPNAPLATPSLENVISPIGTAQDYFYKYEHKKTVTGPVTITILQQPKHGILRLITEADRFGADRFGNDKSEPVAGLYVYLPNKGYYGKDGAVVQVEIGGIKVKQNYYFYPVDNSFSKDWEQEYCKKGYSWKISSTLDANGNGTLTAIDYLPPLTSDASNPATDTAALAAELGSNALGSFATGTSGIALNITDLPDAALGQTTGTTITLDPTAAGHGWFIDATPGSNEEFLPTSNPNEWIAKAGSEAAGRMDMLTVLLHEYGHALGLDHSADSHDFMAATLQPGVRHTLTADEQLALMQLTGYFPTPTHPPAPRPPRRGPPRVGGRGPVAGPGPG